MWAPSPLPRCAWSGIRDDSCGMGGVVTVDVDRRFDYAQRPGLLLKAHLQLWYVCFWVVTSAVLGDRVACGGFWYVLLLKDPYGMTKDWANSISLRHLMSVLTFCTWTVRFPAGMTKEWASSTTIARV
jgi:hypothetical protein